MQPAKTSQSNLRTDPMAGCMHLNVGHKIMKHKNALLAVCGLVLLAYIACCARAFYTPPPLDYRVAVPDEAREVIDNWHKTTDEIPTQPISIIGMRHALLHPIAPHCDRVVIDLYHKDVIQAYYRGNTACFSLNNGSWNFRGVLSWDKIRKMFEAVPSDAFGQNRA